jgi:hypothetical protein
MAYQIPPHGRWRERSALALSTNTGGAYLNPQLPGVLVGTPPRSQVPSNVIKRADPTRLGRSLGT